MTSADVTSLPTTAGEDPAETAHAWFRTMLEQEPVHQDEQGVWQVFGYSDVARILSDHATFSSDLSAFIPSQPDFDLFAKGNFVRMDPPIHRKLRTLVSQVFTPRVVAGLAPRISEITTAQLDTVDGEGPFDLVDTLAYPLPIMVISELLGVPIEDRPRFRSWAEELFSQRVDRTAVPTEEMLEAVVPTVRDMNDYLLARIRERRARPAEDLISRLTAAEVDGERLEDEEIVGFAGLLLLAGHITTTALVGNAVICFDRHPEAAAELRADRHLLPDAIEEVLRYRSPFPRLARVTTTDAEVGGRTLPAGQLVIPWVAAANRDARKFPDPERFDIHRDPVGHLAFGHGIHFCLGAPLARLEAKIALGILLDRYRKIVVDRADVEYQNPWAMIAVKRLPMRVAV